MNEREFVAKWINEIRGDKLVKFPGSFIEGYECESIDLPEAPLLLGSELFGNYEIVDVNGKAFRQVDSYEKAKYILYANRTTPPKVDIPVNHVDMVEATKYYEKHIDSIVVEIEKDYNLCVTQSKGFLEVSNQIFNSLKLQRYY